MNTFYFNKRNSFRDMDLGIVGTIEFPFITEVIENVEVENRSQGSLTIKTGHYNDVKISINLRMFNLTNYKKKIYEINKYFTDITDNRLYFEDYPQKCYKVKNVILNGLEKANKFFGTFSATFVCEPFMYLTKESSVIITNNSRISNIGDLEAEPTIKLTLPSNNQNISIIINDSETQFREVSNYIEINTLKMTTIDNKGLSVTSKMIGDFPVLKQGKNTIQWTGTINKFELLKNTRFKG